MIDDKKFIKDCLTTEIKDFENISGRLSQVLIIKMLHGSMGISTEAGELEDALKKYIFYGKELDTVNIIEEIGDLLYYCSMILNALDVDFETAMTKVIAKLKTRYPKGFTEHDAINRDLNIERNVLEEKTYKIKE